MTERDKRKAVLKAQLQEIEKEEVAEAIATWNLKKQQIIANIDALLNLTPNHGRTSCSDENPCNYYRARCTRCVLLQAKEDGYWSDDFELNIFVAQPNYLPAPS